MTTLKEYYIWLLTVMGAANPRTVRLISHFGGIKKTYEALTSGDVKYLKESEKERLSKASTEKVTQLCEWCDKYEYSIVTIEDDCYPELLKHIHNPPIVLFVQGDIASVCDDVRFAVVGTRNPCKYSYRVTEYICEELAKVGIVLVSGMAVGIDKCAMTSALKANPKVVGVLACGIHLDYPTGSAAFRKEVAASGGVFVSELLPRVETRPAYFPQRNRIISGLASGTLIVEAGERSGCHLTAQHTVDQNRDLFCIPPYDLFDRQLTGVVRYLRDGAIPVFSHLDIINEYLYDVSGHEFDSAGYYAKYGTYMKRSVHVPAPRTDKPLELPKQRKTKSEVKKKPLQPQPPPQVDFSVLSEPQISVINALMGGSMTFDEIVRAELLTIDNAHETLLDMELDGYIERIAGDRFKII